MNQRKFSRQLAAIGFAVLLLGSAVSAQEFRAFWVDSWGAGILNASQVRTLLGTPGDPNDRGRIRERPDLRLLVGRHPQRTERADRAGRQDRSTRDCSLRVSAV